MQPIKLLNGAFTATLVKSKSGSLSWEYTPNFQKLGRIPYQGSEKEKPEFKIVDHIEGEASKGFQRQTRVMVIELVQQLKQYSK